jgi:uncharacterized NAD(P)/FAD-binding protein YdhS
MSRLLLTDEVMETARDSCYHVVIIGGGFSGIVLAVQLLRQTADPLLIAIINRAGLPGRGVAYGTDCEEHLLNVSAGKMSAFPDQPDDFLHWLRSKRGNEVRPEDFVPRRMYGEYLEDTLAQTLKRYPTTIFSWFNEDAISLVLKENRPSISLGNGMDLHAEVAVLATGNAPPGDPPEVDAIRKKFYSSYAWAKDALDRVPCSGSVLILGSGLAAVDQILALHANNFRGRIFLLSRRGQLPFPHSEFVAWPQSWADVVPNKICAMLKAVRYQIKLAAANGVGWQAVIDALRPLSSKIWRSWPLAERNRFLRHVRVYWEVSRHRVPQATHSTLMDLTANGGLCLIAGRLIKTIESDHDVEVVLCKRGTQQVESLLINRIVNCTGPASFNRVPDGLIRGLLDDGLARLDPLHIGVDTEPDGALISKSGEPSDRIYTIGPVRKACLWETTAVSEIREQGVQLASQILTRLYDND